jgi:hypothetical protein
VINAVGFTEKSCIGYDYGWVFCFWGAAALIVRQVIAAEA